ncbi:MAG: peptidase [Thermomicrobiales bacterium]|jgi:hypothetical protein|nr:peptidase [Thermomicrobiales bacterium]MCD6057218.1 peptidase [Thermomicrobiales bacterium]MDF3015164.1 peptidase [Thermomicrobiales bacterium]
MCPTVTQRRPKRRGKSSESSRVSAPLATEAFLSAAAEPVREELSTSVELPDFLETVDPLSLAERQTLVDQALVLLSDNYVHLPFKVSMHGINPLRRLRLLRTRLERQTDETMDSERDFHTEMSAIFHSMRDLHTNYQLPLPYNKMLAYLPFLVEEYRDDNESHYIVSHVVRGYKAPGFEPGAEITHWNGIPIDRAVDVNAARFAGSNTAARHARGVESLTLRSLRIHLPPDEEWVTVNYVGLDGAEHELSEKWLVVENRPQFEGEASSLDVGATAIGLDIGADDISRARRTLFAPESIALERSVAASGEAPVSDDAADVPSMMPGFFRARRVETPSGTLGHVRIYTFNGPPDQPGDEFVREFVQEFLRLIELLPQDGLIIDVRGNGGGHIHASEFTLQMLSPREITPEPAQFINTMLNLRICRKFRGHRDIDLGPWVESMDRALETSEVFSSAFPITPEDGSNAIGQKYHGPVVLITDARCYSATDIFAAGFQDHEIGPVLGVDDNTGAGGANVWKHSLLKLLTDLEPAETDSPYVALPREAEMRVAIRRTLRVGRRSGTPVEDLGVIPDVRYDLTREDLLNDNVGLMNRAGEILAAMPVRKLEATAVTAPEGQLNLQIEANNLDRADIYVNGRPRETVDLTTPTASVLVEGQSGARIRIEGYASGELAAATTFVA